MDGFPRLRAHLIDESRRCIRPPAGRFRHPWLSPSPPRGARAAGDAAAPAHAGSTDVFNTGDYSLGLFHHDASEAAIELLRHEEFVEPCRGSLLNFLDLQEPGGLIHRVEMPGRTHEREPAKAVMAAFALRCAQAGSNDSARAAAWLASNEVYPRLVRWIAFLEREYRSPRGLVIAHSALQTGFDNDLLLVNLPERTVEDPGASAMMALEYDAMAELAALLGESRDAGAWRERAGALRAAMNARLWFDAPDGTTGWYAARRADGPDGFDGLVLDPSTGGEGLPAAPMISWTGALPLYAGVPGADRAAKLARLLTDPRGFWGPAGIRTAPADSLYFNQSPRSLIFDPKAGTRTAVSNWQGPVWVLSSFYLAEGLARHGRADAACEVAARTARLLDDSLERYGTLFECYDDAGRGLWPHAGGFVSWNVLAIRLLDRLHGSAGRRDGG